MVEVGPPEGVIRSTHSSWNGENDLSLVFLGLSSVLDQCYGNREIDFRELR